MPTLTYSEMKSHAIAYGTVPDGYFGRRVACEFSYHEGFVYVVTSCGYFKSCLPGVTSEKEAIFHLQNHANGQKYYSDARLYCSDR